MGVPASPTRRPPRTHARTHDISAHPTKRPRPAARRPPTSSSHLVGDAPAARVRTAAGDFLCQHTVTCQQTSRRTTTALHCRLGKWGGSTHGCAPCDEQFYDLLSDGADHPRACRTPPPVAGPTPGRVLKNTECHISIRPPISVDWLRLKSPNLRAQVLLSACTSGCSGLSSLRAP